MMILPLFMKKEKPITKKNHCRIYNVLSEDIFKDIISRNINEVVFQGLGKEMAEHIREKIYHECVCEGKVTFLVSEGFS